MKQIKRLKKMKNKSIPKGSSGGGPFVPFEKIDFVVNNGYTNYITNFVVK